MRVHLSTDHDVYGKVPLCGQAMWESLTDDPAENECWECASIAGVDQHTGELMSELVAQLGLD